MTKSFEEYVQEESNTVMWLSVVTGIAAICALVVGIVLAFKVGELNSRIHMLELDLQQATQRGSNHTHNRQVPRRRR